MTGKAIRIDIAIPCYQYGRYLRQCVESVQAQELDGIRILIVDNGSSDETAAVARELAAADPRIEIRRFEQNRGPHAAFNEGIAWANGDYFNILAADDLMPPGALARAIDVMERSRDVVFVCGRDIAFNDGEPIPHVPPEANGDAPTVLSGMAYIRERCHRPNHYTAGSVIVRTSAQKRVGGYRDCLPHTDDLELFMRLALLGSVAELDSVQGLRREHGGNRYNEFWGDRIRDLKEREAAFESFFCREGAVLIDRAPLLRHAKRRLASWAYWSAVSHMTQGKFKAAAALGRFALERRPSAALLPPVSWVFDMQHPWARAGELLWSMVRGSRTP